ncbi:MAG: hypothetical protein WEB60_00020 [Terrimicrobiaceae bacterium]
MMEFPKKPWRNDAVRIVEELFPVTRSEHWDDLLELRSLLLSGKNWDRALDVFLDCRDRMEADHYLPFYRLRTLLAGSLRLEAGENPVGSLQELLKRKHVSLESVRRSIERDLFENLDEMTIDDLRVVESR